MSEIRAPKGTFDVLPVSAPGYAKVEAEAKLASRDLDYQQLLVDHRDKHTECLQLQQQLDELNQKHRDFDAVCSALEQQVAQHVTQSSFHRDSLEQLRKDALEVRSNCPLFSTSRLNAQMVMMV